MNGKFTGMYDSSLQTCTEILFPVRCCLTPLSDGSISWKTVADADRCNRIYDKGENEVVLWQHCDMFSSVRYVMFIIKGHSFCSVPKVPNFSLQSSLNKHIIK